MKKKFNHLDEDQENKPVNTIRRAKLIEFRPSQAEEPEMRKLVSTTVESPFQQHFQLKPRDNSFLSENHSDQVMSQSKYPGGLNDEDSEDCAETREMIAYFQKIQNEE